MIRPYLAILIVATAVGGCSRLNPGTWLNSGGTTPTPQGMTAVAPVQDSRPRIDRVTSVNVDRTPNGVIVRAAGDGGTLGWSNAALVAQPVQDGDLVLEFRALPPQGTAGAGTEATRAVIAAAAVTNDDLAGVRRIVVRAEGNALSAAR